MYRNMCRKTGVIICSRYMYNTLVLLMKYSIPQTIADYSDLATIHLGLDIIAYLERIC